MVVLKYTVNCNTVVLMLSNALFSLQFCGGKPSEGVFVGTFLSMSSTAVVVF